MKYKYLALTLGVVLISTLTFFSSCKKINDSTTIGGDLIPAVDNITTFDTTLEVEAYNGEFSLAGDYKDSLKLRGSTDTYFLGNITNDPLFGTSSGTIFTQLKPSNFRFAFNFKKDSLIGLDSVVLVLKYINTYGDTITPQSVNVFEVDQSNEFRYDSSYLVRRNDFTYSNLLGTGTYTPERLKDSMYFYNRADSGSYQLRIKLNDAFGQRLLAYDSTTTAGNNAYSSDSVFNTLFKGFAIIPGGTGNALIGISLASSKLSVYYKYKTGKDSTAVTNFTFTTASASANYIQRDYAGSQASLAQGTLTPAEYVFLQTQPGTFADIKINGLKTLSNRIIHRAELSVTEAYNDMLDDVLVEPNYLYLDAFDSVNNLYRAIPYDITTPDPNTGSLLVTNSSFGFGGKLITDGVHDVREWKFNVSRYVQNIVKGVEPVYNLRLYAPYIARNTFGIGGTDYKYASYINPVATAGRVRVYGGDATGINPKRMKLRIVYSKI